MEHLSCHTSVRIRVGTHNIADVCGSPPVIPAFEKRHSPRSKLAKQTSCIRELWVQGPSSIQWIVILVGEHYMKAHKDCLPCMAQQMASESHVFSFPLVFLRSATEDWWIGMMGFLVAFCQFCQQLEAPKK